jgi:hypothetical protein
MIKIVPATRQHVDALYKEPPGRSMHAIAVVDGDRVLGLGGTYLMGDLRVAFANLSDELRYKHTRFLVKATRAVARTFGNKVVAQCDDRIPGSRSFLEHFGFKQINESFYVWTR